ncbi:hypothetical protein TRFO_19987 [Tritrichomonas foetus]|uniref:Myb-like domain-containing protein n=1 Tax=Tritrichomonas foetus TaxID=1144522 RepID=A0A1J4KGU9_9EUKA|nr:hypothetical protein TRFO_19987 [Tritrichomonas foetus]|eukprot:OHT10593.1 hypothetical protein TRFO_19987 [Tritrichomonas foetus]
MLEVAAAGFSPVSDLLQCTRLVSMNNSSALFQSKRKTFTKEEDVMIVQLYQEYVHITNKWKLIANKIGRKPREVHSRHKFYLSEDIVKTVNKNKDDSIRDQTSNDQKMDFFDQSFIGEDLYLFHTEVKQNENV